MAKDPQNTCTGCGLSAEKRPTTTGFCVQVIRANLQDGHAAMFAAPDGWEPEPHAMHPCEVISEVPLSAVKLIKAPAVMVVWRRQVPLRGASGDRLVDEETGKQRKHDA